MANATKLSRSHLSRDIIIIAASVAFAVYIARSDLIDFLRVGFIPLEAVVVGFFFTSLLTVAPAGVAFAELAHVTTPIHLAAWGALGSVIGDLVLFFFVRDALSRDIMALLRGPWVRKLKALFNTPLLSWAIPVAGAIAIASPLPDEIGIAMLGLSKTDVRFFVPISYAMNFLGILLIGWSVQAL